MTSDGYRVTLESVVRDTRADVEREYEERLRAKDREITALKMRVGLLESHIAVQDGEISRLQAALSETLQQL